MIFYRKPPENILIHTKVVNGHKIYGWNNHWFVTEYLARKFAQKSFKSLEKSIVK